MELSTPVKAFYIDAASVPREKAEAHFIKHAIDEHGVSELFATEAFGHAVNGQAIGLMLVISSGVQIIDRP